ncbi:hypothetical protein [Alishewanella phage vB_AspM_Slicko01]|nr:hypothetical protein [Alishewanella phage vB_AspM_Slicko01]
MSVVLMHDEKVGLLDQLREAFVNNTKATNKINTKKILDRLEHDYPQFTLDYTNSIYEMCMILYKEMNVMTREEMVLVISNKRNHNMDDDEIEMVKSWMLGNDISKDLRSVYFRMNLDVECIEDFLNDTLGY